jgi:hypothetical protein
MQLIRWHLCTVPVHEKGLFDGQTSELPHTSRPAGAGGDLRKVACQQVHPRVMYRMQLPGSCGLSCPLRGRR